MKVAIYHPFQELPDYYSLTHIVIEQLLMLTEHDVETHFIVANNFKGNVPDKVIVHAVLPYDTTENIYAAAEPILKSMDNIFTHDIIYLKVYKLHEEALRQIAQKHPQIQWLHWSHSAPNMNEKREPFPNSLYISPNRTDAPLVAQQNQTPEANVRIVYHSVSPDIFFDWHPFTKHLVKKHNLLDCDILVVYPLDTGRFEAKGGFKIIKLIEKIRKEKRNAKVLFVNAAANTKERTQFVKAIQNEYTIFTSLENPEYISNVPHRIVRELMQIANLFPFLSISETCGLTMLEAALTKNLVILNEDWPPFREFGEIDHVPYMKVSSTRCTTRYGDGSAEFENQYYVDKAREIIHRLEVNQANRFNRKILRMFNREWVWKNQLEPLLRSNATNLITQPS